MRAGMVGKAGAWVSVAVLALLMLPQWAHAEVTLETGVSKVETTLDNAGRVKRELVPVEEVVPGEELRYTITFTNESKVPVDPDRIIITNPIPDGTRYVPGSAGGEDAVVEYSVDGETFSPAEPAATGASAAGADGGGSPVRSVRWIYQDTLAPGASAEVFFHVRMQ